MSDEPRRPLAGPHVIWGCAPPPHRTVQRAGRFKVHGDYTRAPPMPRTLHSSRRAPKSCQNRPAWQWLAGDGGERKRELQERSKAPPNALTIQDSARQSRGAVTFLDKRQSGTRRRALCSGRTADQLGVALVAVTVHTHTHHYGTVNTGCASRCRSLPPPKGRSNPARRRGSRWC